MNSADTPIHSANSSAAESRYRPRMLRPLIWLVLTLASVFFVASLQFLPVDFWIRLGYYVFAGQPFDSIHFRAEIWKHADDGLIYMMSAMGILLAHEFGHYIATQIYKIPATLPYCIPCPISPVGTFGAVIFMDGKKADRRQIFDIGIAGPLAGLVVAIPVVWHGVSLLDLQGEAYGPFEIELPLLIQWIYQWTHQGALAPDVVVFSQLNAYFVAGWFGLIVTGLNMVPMGQLDGGHVTYTLFGTAAHWIARILMVLVIAYQVYCQSMMFVLMIVLIMMVGLEHPPTRDDQVPLGSARWVIGLASLAIPILCLAPSIIIVR